MYLKGACRTPVPLLQTAKSSIRIGDVFESAAVD
jgi:hypothetical protein